MCPAESAGRRPRASGPHDLRGANSVNRKRPPPETFDPHKHATSAATEIELAGYIEDRLGLTLEQIKSITTQLGCDGAAHEVWEELVARRRRAGG